MTFADALALGRVSNLPTVWTNLIAGVVLAGGTLADPVVPVLAAAMTLFYVGGMYLNDFFDAAIDAVERPERPIPAARVSRAAVGGAGFVMLGAGVVLSAGVALHTGSPWPLAGGAALAGCIVLYDRYHKGNPLSPLLMGGCRVLVYVTAGASVASVVAPPLLWGAVVLLAYLIGLTYTAKQENLGRVRNLWPLAFLAAPVLYGSVLAPVAPVVWPFLAGLVAWVLVALYLIRRRGPGDIPRAVVSLIAGISLLDAMLVAASGAGLLALVCVAGFGLTLAAQRFVAGT
jgi:4-hydroxybenzoate polyprenyltransferase